MYLLDRGNFLFFDIQKFLIPRSNVAYCMSNFASLQFFLILSWDIEWVAEL